MAATKKFDRAKKAFKALQKEIAEYEGTFFFVLFGAGSIIASKGDLLAIALGHFIGLSLAILGTASRSGGHLNPGVTSYFIGSGKMPSYQGVRYILAQLLGSISAAIVLRMIFPESMWQEVHLGTPTISPLINIVAAVVAECVGFYILLRSVKWFAVAPPPKMPRISGFGIGLTLAGIISVFGSLTGASVNPARWLGPALMSGTFGVLTVSIIVYLFVPIVIGFTYGRKIG